jgi:hypothetical protein
MNSLESRCGSRLVHEFGHKHFTDRCPSSGRCSLKILQFYPYRNWRTHNFDLPKLFQKTAYYMMHICTCIYLYKCIQYTVYSIQYTVYIYKYIHHTCIYIYSIYTVCIYIYTAIYNYINGHLSLQSQGTFQLLRDGGLRHSAANHHGDALTYPKLNILEDPWGNRGYPRVNI